MKRTIVKISRGQYNVIDENGYNVFNYSTSQNDCQQYINGCKADERFLADERMQRVAMDYINANKMPVSSYGDLRQFMANSIYKMYHGDIRELMRRKEFYKEHLIKTNERNKAARLESIKMNTASITPLVSKTNRPSVEASIYPKTIQESCHSLIHEIAFNIDNGNIEEAKAQLKKVDELLHELS